MKVAEGAAGKVPAWPAKKLLEPIRQYNICLNKGFQSLAYDCNCSMETLLYFHVKNTTVLGCWCHIYKGTRALFFASNSTKTRTQHEKTQRFKKQKSKKVQFRDTEDNLNTQHMCERSSIKKNWRNGRRAAALEKNKQTKKWQKWRVIKSLD